MYSLYKVSKQFKDKKIVSFSCQKKKLFFKKSTRPINYFGVKKRLNLIDGSLSDYTKNDFDRSLSNSCKRSLKTFDDLIEANFERFIFFGTLTFDKKKIDRLDDNKVISAFQNWRNTIKRKFPDLSYLCVREYHKKGGLHFHILVGDTNEQELKLKKTKRIVNGHIIYKCDCFNYGRTDFSYIKDREQCYNYIKKYISKSFGYAELNGKRRFYYSSNLNKPVITKEDICYSENIIDVNNVVDNIYPNNLFCQTISNSKEKNYIIKKFL